MKTVWIILIIIVVVLGGGYLGRHQLKAMLGMSSPQPAVTTSTTSTVTKAASSSAMTPSNNIYMTKTNASKGSYLTDFQGKALYTFDKDTKGVSNCNGSCATTWSPYTSGATAQSQFPANITVIKRSDGSSQFAWKGMPLYYYSSDQKPGDTMGDGVGGVWHLVNP